MGLLADWLALMYGLECWHCWACLLAGWMALLNGLAGLQALLAGLLALLVCLMALLALLVCWLWPGWWQFGDS